MTNHTKPQPALSGKSERYHHGDLRRDLLRFARDEIAANGAQGVSLASLARLAGVVQSAPYRHFTDRQALLEAVAAEGFIALSDAMRDGLATREPTVSSRNAVERAYLRFGEENIELYRLMFASNLTPTASDGSTLDEAAGEAFRLLRVTIVPAAGRDKSDDHEAYRAWALVHGLVMLRADGFIATTLERFL